MTAPSFLLPAGLVRIFLLTTLVSLGVASTAPIKTGTPDMSQGAVCFTFDDLFIAQWVAAAPVFKEYGAHVTFFITHMGKLNQSQKAGLKTLQNEGHAIACHGLHHARTVDFVSKNGEQAYLDSEIFPANDILRQLGFNPTAFAYPFSQNNARTDATLLRVFRHLRTRGNIKGGKLKENDTIFVPVQKIAATGCLLAAVIDLAGTERSPDGVEQVCDALDRAEKHRELVVFYAHNIGDDAAGNHLPLASLRKILDHAKTIGLPTVTYDDLP